MLSPVCRTHAANRNLTAGCVCCQPRIISSHRIRTPPTVVCLLSCLLPGFQFRTADLTAHESCVFRAPTDSIVHLTGVPVRPGGRLQLFTSIMSPAFRTVTQTCREPAPKQCGRLNGSQSACFCTAGRSAPDIPTLIWEGTFTFDVQYKCSTSAV